jgi:hypothetical protein
MLRYKEDEKWSKEERRKTGNKIKVERRRTKI